MTARAQRPQPSGPKSLKGSDEAKRRAAVILEAMCGIRSTQSASEELRIALVRYYVLETRMLQAMIDGLEPRARGRKRDLEIELKKLSDENKRLEREAMRMQALHRITQRAVGVKPASKTSVGKSKDGKPAKTRRVRKQSRGERVLAALKPADLEVPRSLPAPSLGNVDRDQENGGA